MLISSGQLSTIGVLVASSGAQSSASGMPSLSSAVSIQFAIPSLSVSINPSSINPLQLLSIPSQTSIVPGFIAGLLSSQSPLVAVSSDAILYPDGLKQLVCVVPSLKKSL